MSAQVIFLNTMYWTDEEEQHELDKMQEFLHFANIEFNTTYRHLPPPGLKKKKRGRSPSSTPEFRDSKKAPAGRNLGWFCVVE